MTTKFTTLCIVYYIDSVLCMYCTQYTSPMERKKKANALVSPLLTRHTPINYSFKPLDHASTYVRSSEVCIAPSN